MPIYEYQCKECETIVEKIQSNSSCKSIPCSGCQKEAKRIVSLSSFRLMGDGWFKPEYKGIQEVPLQGDNA